MALLYTFFRFLQDLITFLLVGLLVAGVLGGITLLIQKWVRLRVGPTGQLQRGPSPPRPFSQALRFGQRILRALMTVENAGTRLPALAVALMMLSFMLALYLAYPAIRARQQNEILRKELLLQQRKTERLRGLLDTLQTGKRPMPIHSL